MVRALILLSAITLMGCTPPNMIKSERIEKIRKIGFVTGIRNNEMVILDHTGTMDKSYTYPDYRYGAMGVLIGSAIENTILIGVKEYRISNSVKGDLDTIKFHINGQTLKQLIDFNIKEKLSDKYIVVESSIFENKKLSIQKTSECLLDAKKSEIDTLVFIEISYGLAAYKKALASVSINGLITVYDVSSEDIIMQRHIESDYGYSQNRTIEEFASKDGKYLKNDFNEAINHFSTYVSNFLH